MDEADDFRRRRLIRHIAATAALGAGGISGWISAALAQSEAGIVQGVRSLKGRARINGRAAVIGMTVLPGDRIVTEAGAELAYVSDDNAFLQRGDSEVRFGQSAAGFLRVVTGRLLSVFGPGAKTLATTTATIGIRGTGCYIESEARRTYFCLCYGEADLLPMADPSKSETIRTRHHDRPLYIYGPDGEDAVRPAIVANHTDAELSLIEALVGRNPPFLDWPFPSSY